MSRCERCWGSDFPCDECSGKAALPPVRSEPLLDRAELIGILEQHLAVTDEWGGCKLASWQWGSNVVVDGIDAAADAILARLASTAPAATTAARAAEQKGTR